MKTLPLVLIVSLAGLATGTGTSVATGLIFGGQQRAGAVRKAPPLPVFVPAGKILVPLVFPTGRLAGYASIEVQLEIADDSTEAVKARMPFLLDAINMRTYRTPMTSGPDGMLPDLTVFRSIVMAAAAEALGTGIVSRVAIIQAIPA